MEFKPGKVERTKARLGEAVISLLAQMSAEHVTVDTIVERAGMGRATWFRHFSNKTDAVACALVMRWMRWLAYEQPQSLPNEDLLPFLRQVYEQRETVTLLYAQGMRQAVLDSSEQIAKVLRGGKPAGYFEKFYLYGFVGVLDEWVGRDFAESPEEVAAMLGCLAAGKAETTS